MERYDNIGDYDEYINKLELNEKYAYFRFLIMNEDRHLNNFGIIRDVNTLKWLDAAPIFDNGQSLNIEYYNDEKVVIFGHGRLVYEVKSFDEIVKILKE